MKILKFYADWCQPCHQQSSILDGLEGIDIESVNVDDEDRQELVEKYEVRSLPTLVILNSKGEEVSRRYGLTPIEKLREDIDKCNDTEV